MAEKTTQKIIQDKVIEMLNANINDLTIREERPPLIVNNLPEAKFSQKQLPMIVVFRPVISEQTVFDWQHDRIVYGLPILFIDSFGVSAESASESMEYMDLLIANVKKLFKQTTNLNLAKLHVYTNHLSFFENIEEDDGLGNNMFKVNLTVEIPTVQDKDVILSE